MKNTSILISILALAACGGKKAEPAQPKEPPPPAAEPAPVAETKPEPTPEPPPPPPPPPPPRSWHAHADMTPVKGAKIKGASVTFNQEEGKPTVISSKGWFDGIKSGTYHLVVHEAAACGPNATKAGKPGSDLEFVAAKGMDAVDVGESSAVQLDGESTIVGHTLVLHDDKKGKPGKALACGPIVMTD